MDDHNLTADDVFTLIMKGQWTEIDRRMTHETKLAPQPTKPQPLVYKTKTFERQPKPSAAVMDDASWNAWASAVARKVVHAEFSKGGTMFEVIAKVIYLVRKELRDEFSEQLGQQRAEIEILRSIIKCDVATIKGNRDAA